MKYMNYLSFIFFLLYTTISFAQTNNSGMMDVDFFGKKVSAKVICIAGVVNTTDTKDVKNIADALIGVAEEPELLDINFIMGDKPLDGDMFVFNIESEEARKLNIELFDSEGFSMVASCVFNISAGSSFNVVIVSTLSNGDYYVRLKDKEGRELNRELTILRKEAKDKD